MYPPKDPDKSFHENEAATKAVFEKRDAIVNAMFARVCSHILKSGSLAEAITTGFADDGH